MSEGKNPPTGQAGIEERPEDGKTGSPSFGSVHDVTEENILNNTQADSIPETLPEAVQPETEITKSNIPKSETENMEVHHHPQVEKKEYFLEGLMIFLAVTQWLHSIK